MCYNVHVRKGKEIPNTRKARTMTLKEAIKKINNVAYDNFEVAEGMLEIVNDIMGTKFGWLNRRVVIFDNPDASIEEKYAHCKDAWANLD